MPIAADVPTAASPPQPFDDESIIREPLRTSGRMSARILQEFVHRQAIRSQRFGKLASRSAPYFGISDRGWP